MPSLERSSTLSLLLLPKCDNDILKHFRVKVYWVLRLFPAGPFLSPILNAGHVLS